MIDDNRPFPIQQDTCKTGEGIKHLPACTIPWWLAEIAYEWYLECFGTSQSLERIAQRGGFGRQELISLIRKERFQ